MAEKYLYDPDPRRRRSKKRRSYDPDPRRRTRRRHYDPVRRTKRRHYDPGISSGLSGLMDNLIFWAGSAADAYLTSKHGDKIPVLMSNVKTIDPKGQPWTLYSTEGIGIGGAVLVPFLSKKKWADYLSKFLAGMGSTAVIKAFDPMPDQKSETGIKKEPDKMKEFRSELISSRSD